jgi:hypothetical protein
MSETTEQNKTSFSRSGFCPFEANVMQKNDAEA